MLRVGEKCTWNFGMIKIHPGSDIMVDGFVLIIPMTPANSY